MLLSGRKQCYVCFILILSASTSVLEFIIIRYTFGQVGFTLVPNDTVRMNKKLSTIWCRKQSIFVVPSDNPRNPKISVYGFKSGPVPVRKSAPPETYKVLREIALEPNDSYEIEFYLLKGSNVSVSDACAYYPNSSFSLCSVSNAVRCVGGRDDANSIPPCPDVDDDDDERTGNDVLNLAEDSKVRLVVRNGGFNGTNVVKMAVEFERRVYETKSCKYKCVNRTGCSIDLSFMTSPVTLVKLLPYEDDIRCVQRVAIESHCHLRLTTYIFTALVSILILAALSTVLVSMECCSFARNRLFSGYDPLECSLESHRPNDSSETAK